jgi:hypothetical protein
MRYRWDPAYPMARRDTQAQDATMRASDDERNAVADKLSRHYAEGRLDEAEFKARLDAAMSATKRGELYGLFHDLPPLTVDPPPPPPRRHRAVGVLLLIGFLVVVTAATLPYHPFFRVPWLLIGIVGFVLWRRSRWHHSHDHHHYHYEGGHEAR